MTAHDKCGLPIKSAITGGKYEEFQFIYPSIHPVFWFLHHRGHWIRLGQVVVAVVIVVGVVVVGVIVVVVVVQWG